MAETCLSLAQLSSRFLNRSGKRFFTPFLFNQSQIAAKVSFSFTTGSRTRDAEKAQAHALMFQRIRAYESKTLHSPARS